MSPFQELLADLGKLEPRSGWSASSWLRDLTDLEIAICIAESPTIADVLDTPDNFSAMLVQEMVRTSSPAARAAAIGFVLRRCLEKSCMQWLLQELMTRESQ